MRVLLTGATGLLGRRVGPGLLARGAEVVRLSAQGREGSRPCDLTDPQAALAAVAEHRPDVVLHLAGGQHPDPETLYLRNVLATVNLLEATARNAPEAAVLVCGSAAEYGEGTGSALTEAAAARPVNDYGRAKLAQTTLARGIASARGLRLTVLRPFNVVADDLPAATPLGNARRQLLASEGPVATLALGRTDLARDFAAADDVGRLLEELATREDLPDVLNLCTGTTVRLDELLQACATALGRELVLRPDPALLALPAAATVLGDAGRLRALGLGLDGSVPRLVEALLGTP